MSDPQLKPPPRPGPALLPLQLSLAAIALHWPSALQHSLSASPSWNASSPPCRLSQKLGALLQNPAQANALLRALDAEARKQTGEYLSGLNSYAEARTLRPAEFFGAQQAARQGNVKLWDFGAPSGNAPCVLLIPSLVNRAHILDLLPEDSLAAMLRARGFHVFLLDWGAPGAQEQANDLAAYLRCALSLMALLPPRPHLLGYCLGGLLALALAQAAETKIGKLVLLSPPWDFAAGWPKLHRALAACGESLRPIPPHHYAGLPPVPALLLQSYFLTQQPAGHTKKFRNFGLTKGRSADERARFIAVEDWVNDGVALATPAAAECLWHLFAENRTARGQWAPLGAPLLPQNIPHPALIVAPQQDRIVPPPATRPLAMLLPHGRLLALAGGHLSVVAGRHTHTEIWPAIADFLA